MCDSHKDTTDWSSCGTLRQSLQTLDSTALVGASLVLSHRNVKTCTHKVQRQAGPHTHTRTVGEAQSVSRRAHAQSKPAPLPACPA